MKKTLVTLLVAVVLVPQVSFAAASNAEIELKIELLMLQVQLLQRQLQELLEREAAAAKMKAEAKIEAEAVVIEAPVAPEIAPVVDESPQYVCVYHPQGRISYCGG